MKTLVLILGFVSALSASAFAADNISVTVNGKSYQCSGDGGGNGGGCVCDFQHDSNSSYPDVCLYPTPSSNRAISCWYGGVIPDSAFKSCREKMRTVCGS